MLIEMTGATEMKIGETVGKLRRLLAQSGIFLLILIFIINSFLLSSICHCVCYSTFPISATEQIEQQQTQNHMDRLTLRELAAATEGLATGDIFYPPVPARPAWIYNCCCKAAPPNTRCHMEQFTWQTLGSSGFNNWVVHKSSWRSHMRGLE